MVRHVSEHCLPFMASGDRGHGTRYRKPNPRTHSTRAPRTSTDLRAVVAGFTPPRHVNGPCPSFRSLTSFPGFESFGAGQRLGLCHTRPVCVCCNLFYSHSRYAHSLHPSMAHSYVVRPTFIHSPRLHMYVCLAGVQGLLHSEPFFAPGASKSGYDFGYNFSIAMHEIRSSFFCWVTFCERVCS